VLSALTEKGGELSGVEDEPAAERVVVAHMSNFEGAGDAFRKGVGPIRGCGGVHKASEADSSSFGVEADVLAMEAVKNACARPKEAGVRVREAGAAVSGGESALRSGGVESTGKSRVGKGGERGNANGAGAGHIRCRQGATEVLAWFFLAGVWLKGVGEEGVGVPGQGGKRLVVRHARGDSGRVCSEPVGAGFRGQSAQNA